MTPDLGRSPAGPDGPRATAYFVEARRTDGSAAGDVRIEPDFGPAFECVRFSGIRRGQLPARLDTAPGAVEPLWHPEHGAPYIRAFRVTVRDGEAAVSHEIGIEYVDTLAREALSQLVTLGRLTAGEGCSYRVALREAPVAPLVAPAADELELDLEDEALPLHLSPGSLEPLRVVSKSFGPASSPEEGRDDVPVVLPREALEEAIVLSHQAGDDETGGFLLGGLQRDPETKELFVRVTAQIPAEHTVCAHTQMSFTPETWVAAHETIERRGLGEELVGWHHHHPAFCRKCPVERRTTCPLNGTFFSAADVNLHSVCFSRAHQIALLLTSLPDGGQQVALFGWRGGRVAERGFHLLPTAGEPGEPDAQ